MTSPTPLITGTDFITVATRDLDTALGFYGGVLGLTESKRWGQMPAVEVETGNLTIALMQSDAFGIEFRAHNHPIELRVDNVEAAHVYNNWFRGFGQYGTMSRGAAKVVAESNYYSDGEDPIVAKDPASQIVNRGNIFNLRIVRECHRHERRKPGNPLSL